MLITQMADDVRHDGGRFVLMGKDVDLQKLDMPAFKQRGIPLVRIDPAFSPNTLIANDGHPKALGHRRIGELLTYQLEQPLREVIASR
ncbi:hypothetical protein [uncultured Mycobacterium sp.]|uniref:hypothetical protein n=1 Tax=uncultured Mycobacterium sp. TaxID=171292 RepID=UPI0035CB110C